MLQDFISGEIEMCLGKFWNWLKVNNKGKKGIDLKGDL